MTDKPYRTYEQQIQQLRDRHLNIPDSKFAEEVIKDRSYYGLINGFKDSYTYRDEDGKEFFHDSVSLNDLVAEYQIESDFKDILLRFSLLAEIRLKEAIANELGKSFGVDPINYLDKSHYTNRTGKKNSILNKIKCVLNTTYNLPTSYYRNNHDVVPPWILLPNLALGQLRLLYISLKPQQLNAIVKNMLYLDGAPTEEEKGFISNGVGILLGFRNTLAHGSRLLKFHSRSMLGYDSIVSVLGTHLLSENEYYDLNMGKNDFFSLIIVIIILLGKIDKPIFTNSITGLMQTFTIDPTMKKHFENYINENNLPSDLSYRLNAL